MRRRSSISSSASDGCRVRKKVVDFKPTAGESTVDYCSSVKNGCYGSSVRALRREVWGSRRLGVWLVSIRTVRPHSRGAGPVTALGDGCYGPVNPSCVEHNQGGKGVKC